MNIFKKNNILIRGLISNSFEYLQKVYNQSRNVFTVASAWGQILFVVQNISQMILYFIEDSITELNIYQATRDHSVKSLARIAGYDPGRANTSQGEIFIKWNNQTSDIGGNAVIIYKNSKIRCEQNGLTYSLILNGNKIKMLLEPGQGKKIKIVQGSFKEATVTGTGRNLQSFNINSIAGSYIDQNYVDVFINGERWKKYDSLYDIPFNEKGFITKSGISSGIDIFFGNTNFGKIPEQGSIIKIEYLETLGIAGNIISKKESPATYKFIESGEDLFGREININDYITIDNIIDPSFGTDPESIDLIRLMAPKTSRSFVFANAENYEMFLEKLGVFSQVNAFSTFDDDNLEDDNIIYIYLVPDVTLNLKSDKDYFDLEVENFLLTDSQRKQVINLIEDSGSMIASTVVKILEPSISKYVINVSITIFEGYDEEVIRDSIRDIISEYFIHLKRRDRIPKSDLIAIIESIDGIDSVAINFVGEKNEKYHKSLEKQTGISFKDKNRLIGFNIYGDIIIERGEIVLIKGGFNDRNGIYFSDKISKNKPSSLNITVTEIVPSGYSSIRTREQKKALIDKNN